MSQSLYERLGKWDGIQAIASELIDLHLANPLINARFKAHDPADLKRLATEFFAAGSGGPETYTGRDMPTAHAGMNISEQEFVAALDDALVALERCGIGQREKEEVLMILYSMKGDVIRQ